MKNKFDYGVYFVKDNYYEVKFYNLITGNYERICYTDNIKDGQIAYSNYQFEFYSKHKYLLPKNIGLDYDRKKFMLSIYFQGKIIFNKRFDTVQLCMKCRNDLIQII